jgi:hypothetical protein
VVHSDFAAAFAPGTRFAREDGDPVEMSTRVLGQLRVPSGRLLVADPFTTTFEEPGPALARTAPTGIFPVEVALARFDDADQRIACARVRFGAPEAPVERWDSALWEGQEPFDDGSSSAYEVDAGMGCFFDRDATSVVDEATANAWLAAIEARRVDTWTWHVTDLGKANLLMFSSGWGDGVYPSYWGLDARGEIVELVTDFEVLLGATHEKFEIPLPLPRGSFSHALLKEHAVTFRVPFLSRTTVILGGKGSARVALSDGTPVAMVWKGEERHYTWKKAAPDAKLLVSVMTGVKPLAML